MLYDKTYWSHRLGNIDLTHISHQIRIFVVYPCRAQYDCIIRLKTFITFPLHLNCCHMQMSTMSKEFKCLARRTYLRKRIRIHDSNVIPGQIYKRIPETINAERECWKDRRLPILTIGFRSKRGRGRTELVSEIRPRIRTIVHLSAVDYFTPRCKPFAHCHPAALRDARHFSARFNLRKMPAIATHRSIPRICVDTRYSYMTRPRNLHFQFLRRIEMPLWHFDTRNIIKLDNCSTDCFVTTNIIRPIWILCFANIIDPIWI